jgi:hypothetical protein
MNIKPNQKLNVIIGTVHKGKL